MDIKWINEPSYHDDDTKEFQVIPNLYTGWQEQPLVTMFHQVSHKRRTGVRRYGPLYRVMKSQGWVELEQS